MLDNQGLPGPLRLHSFQKEPQLPASKDSSTFSFSSSGSSMKLMHQKRLYPWARHVQWTSYTLLLLIHSASGLRGPQSWCWSRPHPYRSEQERVLPSRSLHSIIGLYPFSGWEAAGPENTGQKSGDLSRCVSNSFKSQSFNPVPSCHLLWARSHVEPQGLSAIFPDPGSALFPFL